MTLNGVTGVKAVHWIFASSVQTVKAVEFSDDYDDSKHHISAQAVEGDSTVTESGRTKGISFNSNRCPKTRCRLLSLSLEYATSLVAHGGFPERVPREKECCFVFHGVS